MPEKETIERAREDAREGKSPSTQAGEFVREEMHHIREGKHGARSTKQAIAIGLSKTRRAGVKLNAPMPETSSSQVRRKAQQDLAKGEAGRSHPSKTRSRATTRALKREEGHSAATKKSLGLQAHAAANARTASSRRKSARKAVRTKARLKSHR